MKGGRRFGLLRLFLAFVPCCETVCVNCRGLLLGCTFCGRHASELKERMGHVTDEVGPLRELPCAVEVIVFMEGGVTLPRKAGL